MVWAPNIQPNFKNVNISLRWFYDFFNIYEILTASRINFCKKGKQTVNLQVIDELSLIKYLQMAEKNTLLEKILGLRDKYESLQTQLSDPDVISDMKKYVQ